MKILVQWSRGGPRDWEEIDSSDWASFAAKPVPRGGELLDDSPGWVNRLNVQGVIFETFDHYAVEDVTDGTVVSCWNDDNELTQQVLFRALAPDARFGGAINTRQEWQSFVKPPDVLARHGVMMSDAAFEAHQEITKARGWREWVDGLSPDDVDGDRVKVQRAIGRYDKPKGTRTYYYSNTAEATALWAAGQEMSLLTTTSTAGDLTATVKKNQDTLAFVGQSPANEPNSAAWPTGDYRWQMDITSAGADLTYGLLTLGASDGVFARINSNATLILETKTQSEGAFSLTGLKLATTGSVSWTAGDATDRFAVVMAAINANSKANQDLILQANEADDFADGPWAAAAPRRIFIS